MDKKKIIFKKRTNSIIIIAIISLIIGALAGIISAFYVTDVLIDQEGTSLIPLLQ